MCAQLGASSSRFSNPWCLPHYKLLATSTPARGVDISSWRRSLCIPTVFPRPFLMSLRESFLVMHHGNIIITTAVVVIAVIVIIALVRWKPSSLASGSSFWFEHGPWLRTSSSLGFPFLAVAFTPLLFWCFFFSRLSHVQRTCRGSIPDASSRKVAASSCFLDSEDEAREHGCFIR